MQVWDIPAITLEKVRYLLPPATAAALWLWKTTTAVPPCGAAGT